MPLSSTIRTDGRPSGVAVASAIRSASMIPDAAASSNHSPTSASGSLRRASGPSSDGTATIQVASERHGDVLDAQVLVDALRPALAAEAGRLHAAERRGRVGDDALVEADHAGLELLDDAERALDVARVDVRHEPVLGVVRRGDRGVLVVEADHRGDGAEDLLLQQPRFAGHAAEHRGLVEVAGAVAGLAADHDLRALAGGVVDELGHLAALVVVDQRPDLDVLVGA